MTVGEATGHEPRHGMLADGIRYVTWGSGPKTLLFVSGEEAPAGLMLRSFRWLLAPYVEAGYAVSGRSGSTWPRTTPSPSVPSPSSSPRRR